jgi:2-iminobutanoate/2-iminopropanoate deaminase
MAFKLWNPDGIASPGSRYSHAASVGAQTELLILSGQIGVRPDGTVAEGLQAQLDQCFANVGTALTAAGMTRSDLIKLTIYVTDPSPAATATYRARRDAFIGDGPAPATTYLVVAGLASPAYLAEIEAIAGR